MFEKCGLRDVLFNINKYKFYILGVMIVFVLFGFLISYSTPKETTEVTISSGQWISSASYMVTLSSDAVTDDSSVDQVKDKEISMANTFANILKADFSMEKIYNALLERYTKEDLIYGLSLSVSPESLSFSL